MKLSEKEFEELMAKRKGWGKALDKKPKPKPMCRPSGKPEIQLGLDMDALDFGLEDKPLFLCGVLPSAQYEAEQTGIQEQERQRIIYNITPVPKPRQTQRDKWKKRPVVERYRAFKDQVKASGLIVPESGCRMIFVMPMPGSWTNQKRDQMRGMPHQQKPDADNMVKAVLDAVLTEDSHIYHVDGLKFWGDVGQIIIERTAKAIRLDGTGIIWDEVA